MLLFHQNKKLKTKCTVNIIQDTDCEEYNSDSLGYPDMVQAGPYMPVAHCVNVLSRWGKNIWKIIFLIKNFKNDFWMPTEATYFITFYKCKQLRWLEVILFWFYFPDSPFCFQLCKTIIHVFLHDSTDSIIHALQIFFSNQKFGAHFGLNPKWIKYLIN